MIITRWCSLRVISVLPDASSSAVNRSSPVLPPSTDARDASVWSWRLGDSSGGAGGGSSAANLSSQAGLMVLIHSADLVLSTAQCSKGKGATCTSHPKQEWGHFELLASAATFFSFTLTALRHPCMSPLFFLVPEWSQTLQPLRTL